MSSQSWLAQNAGIQTTRSEMQSSYAKQCQQRSSEKGVTNSITGSPLSSHNVSNNYRVPSADTPARTQSPISRHKSLTFDDSKKRDKSKRQHVENTNTLVSPAAGNPANAHDSSDDSDDFEEPVGEYMVTRAATLYEMLLSKRYDMIGGYATHDVTYLTLVQAHYINLAKEDKDGSGNTALHLAVKENDDVAVNGLLKIGCNPNARNNKGETPLHIIIDQNTRGGNITMALLEYERRSKQHNPPPAVLSPRESECCRIS